jgi:hypothetical protein
MSGTPEQDGVYLKGQLPLSWEATSGFDANQLERWMHADLALLRALAVLDSNQPEAERDTTTPTNKVLDRLEAKTDLALALIIQLLGQQTTLPPTCSVILRASTIEWITDQAPPVGASIVVSIHLSSKLPLPLVLPAKVAMNEDTPAGTRIRAHLGSLDEEVQDWLERTLFRHHRRAVQQQRQGG